MTYGSVCSGIEAATVAWSPLGWQPAWFSEIEPFCCDLLKHRYPTVKNYGDFTKITTEQSGPIDLLCGGTPCQDFSVAGLRAGLAGARGNLTLEFVALAERIRPRWVVWENVPGVLSIDNGGAFGAFLSGLAELGYGFAYRVLDAQYFGVPQRRRRIYVVGYLGDWRCAAAVLFERQSLSGHPPPSREAREEVAGTLTGGTDTGSNHGKRSGSDRDTLVAGCLGGGSGSRGWCPETDRMTFVPDVAYGLNAHPSRRYDAQANETFVAGTLNANGKAAGSATQQDAESGLLVVHSLRGDGFDAGEDGTGRGTPLVPVAFRASGQDGFTPSTICPPLCNTDGGGIVPSMLSHMAVRRLTPRECERLMEMPDDYTLIPRKDGKMAKDGPRYKAIGNSWAVPCASWIGERIQAVEDLL